MCLTGQDSVSKAVDIDSLRGLSFFVRDETGIINKSSSALGSKKTEGPTFHCRMTVDDLSEDG